VIDTLSLLERVHGHLGWLAAASLAHPAVVLRRPRRAPAAVIASTAIATLAGGLGAWLYVPFRETVRPALYETAPRFGLLFERKEHLAFGAIVFAWVGCLAYFSDRQRLARRAYVAATLLAVAVAVMGTVVAAVRSF